MSEPKDSPKAIESLLEQLSLTQPSPMLDARMDQLLQPRWRRMVGPALGFAAGILVTISIGRALPGAVNSNGSPNPPPAEHH